MNFCPKCGTQLKSNIKFCPNCGQGLTTNVGDNITNNSAAPMPFSHADMDGLLPPLPPKKRVPVWVWIIGAIVVIGVVGMIYGAITYPKNETQVANLICNKYWKESDVTVEEIYYDGKMVRKGKNIVSNIENAFDGLDGDAVYKKFEGNLKAIMEYDNYFFYKKMKDGSYWQYGQWIDSKQHSNYIFGTDNYSLQRLSSHFVLHNTNKTSYNYYVETGDFYESFDVDEDSSEILSLDENELTVRNTLVMGKVKVVTQITYKKSAEASHDTKQLKSYLEVLELGNVLAPSNSENTKTISPNNNNGPIDTNVTVVDSSVYF